MKIIFATHNKHKLAEIRDMLKNQFELIGLSEINYDKEIPEDYDTLEGNALQKARIIFSSVNTSNVTEDKGIACFADDTGLEVEALNGAPGVFSARYSGTIFENEKERSLSNIKKLLEELREKKSRKARFRTAIAYVSHNQEIIFEGIVNGTIIDEMRGTEGFGYDSVFVPDGYTKTFAELSMQEKSNISHRAIAFNKLVAYLLSK